MQTDANTHLGDGETTVNLMYPLAPMARVRHNNLDHRRADWSHAPMLIKYEFVASMEKHTKIHSSETKSSIDEMDLIFFF